MKTLYHKLTKSSDFWEAAEKIHRVVWKQFFNDYDAPGKLARLVIYYDEAKPEDRQGIDTAMIAVCGCSVPTLVKKASMVKVDPHGFSTNDDACQAAPPDEKESDAAIEAADAVADARRTRWDTGNPYEAVE